MGRHATRRPTRRRRLPLVLAGAAVVAGTAVLVPVLGSDDSSRATAPVPRAAPAELSVVIGGPVAFAGRTLALVADPAGPFPGVQASLQDADVALADLTTALPEGAAAALAAAGVDLVAVTGSPDPAATAATLDGLSAAGLRPVGAGRDATAAASPQRVESGDSAVTVLALAAGAAASDAGADSPGLAGPGHADAVLAAVGVADRRGDLVVVRVVGGEPCGPDTVALADRLADAGADVVVGVGLPGAGAWSAEGDRHAWLVPSPGPLLSADEAGPSTTGLVRLVVRDGAVVGAALDPAEVDPFGRAGSVTQTSISTTDAQTPPGAPCEGVGVSASGP